jgi:hypothetical protein
MPAKGHGQWPPLSPQIQTWTDNEDRPVSTSLYYDNTAPHTLVDDPDAGGALSWTRDPDNPWTWLLLDDHGGNRYAYSISGTSGAISLAELNANGFFVFDNIGQMVPGVSPE